MTPDANRPLRVLYSFPHRIGASRICHTAWQQVRGIAAAGASVLACPASVAESLPDSVEVRPTLSAGRWRLPFSLVGDRRAFDLHDRLVAHRLQKLGGRIDVVHAWPLGARRTLDVARRMGIPTVLERPNAHTRFAYRVVQQECERLGIRLPAGHEHSYNDAILAAEEREYRLATRLLCPSDFVAMTFIDEGWPRGRLARHQYGFDEQIFYPTAGRDGVSG
ncbi:MAG: glycosyltransferase family 4 protein, partial [Rhizobacter sp.]|nr:glycosyltransferase family 4 protein [Rhizobacter sp.]